MSPGAMIGFWTASALSATAGTTKLTPNAPAAMPTIKLSRRRLPNALPGYAIVTDLQVRFIPNECLLTKEQQNRQDEAASTRGGTYESRGLLGHDCQSNYSRPYDQQDRESGQGQSTWCGEQRAKRAETKLATLRPNGDRTLNCE